MYHQTAQRSAFWREICAAGARLLPGLSAQFPVALAQVRVPGIAADGAPHLGGGSGEIAAFFFEDSPHVMGVCAGGAQVLFGGLAGQCAGLAPLFTGHRQRSPAGRQQQREVAQQGAAQEASAHGVSRAGSRAQ